MRRVSARARRAALPVDPGRSLLVQNAIEEIVQMCAADREAAVDALMNGRWPDSVPELGRFQGLEKLKSQGGMARVYRARDPERVCDATIKIIPLPPRAKRPEGSDEADDEADTEPSKVRRFRREADILEKLRIMPGIPDLLCSCTEAVVRIDGRGVPCLFLGMKHIDGAPPAPRKRQSKEDIVEALRVGSDVADLLVFVHKVGVVNRDIKLSHILVSNVETEPPVHLLDWGIAGVWNPELSDTEITTETSSSLPGTERYVPPERLPGTQLSADDANSAEGERPGDIFSLGVTLFRILTGDWPAQTGKEPIDYQCLNSLPSDLPGSVRELLRACLDSRPHQRPTAETMRDTLRQALKAVEAPGEYEGSTSGTIVPSDRRRRAAGVLVGSTVLICLAVAAVLGRGSLSPSSVLKRLENRPGRPLGSPQLVPPKEKLAPRAKVTRKQNRVVEGPRRGGPGAEPSEAEQCLLPSEQIPDDWQGQGLPDMPDHEVPPEGADTEQSGGERVDVAETGKTMESNGSRAVAGEQELVPSGEAEAQRSETPERPPAPIPDATVAAGRKDMADHWRSLLRDGNFEQAGSVLTKRGQPEALLNAFAEARESYRNACAVVEGALQRASAAGLDLERWESAATKCAQLRGRYPGNVKAGTLGDSCTQARDIARRCAALDGTITNVLQDKRLDSGAPDRAVAEHLFDKVRQELKDMAASQARLRSSLEGISDVNLEQLGAEIRKRGPDAFLRALSGPGQPLTRWRSFLRTKPAPLQPYANKAKWFIRREEAREIIAKIVMLRREGEFASALSEATRLERIDASAGKEQEERVTREARESFEKLLQGLNLDLARDLVDSLPQERKVLAQVLAKQLDDAKEAVRRIVGGSPEKSEAIDWQWRLDQVCNRLDEFLCCGAFDRARSAIDAFDRFEVWQQRRFEELAKAEERFSTELLAVEDELADLREQAAYSQEAWCALVQRSDGFASERGESCDARRLADDCHFAHYRARSDEASAVSEWAEVWQLWLEFGEGHPDSIHLDEARRLQKQARRLGKKQLDEIVSSAKSQAVKLVANGKFDEAATVLRQGAQDARQLDEQFEGQLHHDPTVFDGSHQLLVYHREVVAPAEGQQAAQRYLIALRFLERHPESPYRKQAEAMAKQALVEGEDGLRRLLREAAADAESKVTARKPQEARRALERAETQAKGLMDAFAGALGPLDRTELDAALKSIVEVEELEEALGQDDRADRRADLRAFVQKYPSSRHMGVIGAALTKDARALVAPHLEQFGRSIPEAVTEETYDAAQAHLDEARRVLAPYGRDFGQIAGLGAAVSKVADDIEVAARRLNATLTIRSTPEKATGADVFINGHLVGQTPLSQYKCVARGCTYRVKLRKLPDWVPSPETEIHIKSEGDHPYDLPLEHPSLPATLSKSHWTIPTDDRDQHDNPVEAREGTKFDPISGWPYEIWLDHRAERWYPFRRKRSTEITIEFVLVPSGECMVRKVPGDTGRDALGAGRSASGPRKLEVCGSGLFHERDVVSCGHLCIRINEERMATGPSPGRRIWELLSPGIQRTIESIVESKKRAEKRGSENWGAKRVERWKIVQALDDLLERSDLYRRDDFSGLRSRVCEILARGGLSDVETKLYNRLLLGLAYPQFVVPAEMVRLHRPLYLSKYEITEAQYEAYVPRSETRASTDPRVPASGVGWDHVQRFCKRLTRDVSTELRLPTDEEWEHACRAGTVSRYYWGETWASKWANACSDPARGSALKPVGEYEPNAFGLYDMIGNVREWCSTRLAYNQYAVLRGGSCHSTSPQDVMCGVRYLGSTVRWSIPAGCDCRPRGFRICVVP